MRKMFKYTPLYANGKEPVIEEQCEHVKGQLSDMAQDMKEERQQTLSRGFHI